MFPLQNRSAVLLVIVLSQFFCTSLWFASNGIMTDLAFTFQLQESALSHLTSAVQLGFISGTFLFALVSIADRYSPSKVFFASAILGALFNLGAAWDGNTLFSLLGFRFLTGFFLAGIYPVGMKIAADFFEKGLGTSLGFLVGALVLGTALPHLLKDSTQAISWKAVLVGTSSLAALGGSAIFIFVGNGPFRKRGTTFELSTIFKVFRNKLFREAAMGYFGHMWELYAFWAFVPFLLTYHKNQLLESELPVALLSFLIISVGSVSCVAAGYLSKKINPKKIARTALLVSGICCLISPMVLSQLNSVIVVGFLFVWGFFVIADSPLFSTLVAHNAPAENKGTALTIVNCIGFAISIGSIQLLGFLSTQINPSYIFLFLALGPAIGLLGLFKNDKKG